MKKLFLIFLLFCSFNTIAQSKIRIDSVYYLIDTTKTPANERMWDVHEEYPSFKFYAILCPCLKYDQNPSFIYDMQKDKGRLISGKELRAIKTIDLPVFILKAKQFKGGDYKGKYAIFLIEPKGKKYIVHQVRMLNPVRPSAPTIDYENITTTDSSKLKKL